MWETDRPRQTEKASGNRLKLFCVKLQATNFLWTHVEQCCGLNSFSLQHLDSPHPGERDLKSKAMPCICSAAELRNVGGTGVHWITTHGFCRQYWFCMCVCVFEWLWLLCVCASCFCVLYLCLFVNVLHIVCVCVRAHASQTLLLMVVVY